MTSPHAEKQHRRSLRDVSDGALLESMRAGDVEAWHEFMVRFRPLLLQYGSRTRMDAVEWSSCVDMVLEEAAMRWASDGAAPPKSIAGYLLRAVSFRRRTVERDEKRRARWQARAVREGEVEGAVLSLCSEAAVRATYGPDESGEDHPAEALARFSQLLCEPLSDDERAMLARLGDGLPHREIAAELGIGYETGRKRIQRLCAKVRALVPGTLEKLSAKDRAQIERFLLRIRPHRSGGADDVV